MHSERFFSGKAIVKTFAVKAAPSSASEDGASCLNGETFTVDAMVSQSD